MRTSPRERFYEMDIRSGCDQAFKAFEPEALSHQAAQMDIRRSVREPHFDADVNFQKPAFLGSQVGDAPSSFVHHSSENS